MQPIRNQLLPVERLTPEREHFFFGYYDNPAWNGVETYHLCQRVKFWERLPAADDVAQLGMIRLADRTFIPIAETTAWNFQQGTMLQWHPLAPDDEVIFNRFLDDRFVGVIRNVHSGNERLLSRPVANVDPTGKYAVSVNFARMFDFRPGYGYANMPDPFTDVAAPEDDGVFIVDLATGESRLLVSLAEIARLFPGKMAGAKLLINHLTFNTDGSRLVMLARNFAAPPHQWWETALATADQSGKLYALHDYGYASHYHWRDQAHLLIYGDAGGLPGLYLLTDQTPNVKQLDPAFFTFDGHCSYSPDRRWLLYDSYPTVDRYRKLFIYDLAQGRAITLGEFYADPAIDGDIRCDLHPRWNRSGTAISFDSIHEGYRGVYLMDVSEITTRPH